MLHSIQTNEHMKNVGDVRAYSLYYAGPQGTVTFSKKGITGIEFGRKKSQNAVQPAEGQLLAIFSFLHFMSMLLLF